MKKFIKKNKYIILYLVGILLLSTGLSYAYFSSNITGNGSGDNTSGTTANVATATVNAEENIAFSNSNIYPGHTELVSLKVTGTGDNEPVIYNLIYNGTNTFTSDINYKIYKTTSLTDASITCEKKTSIVSGSQILSEECSKTNMEALGEVVGSGTLVKSSTSTTQTLLENQIIITSSTGTVEYYYIEIEYPNLNESQNDDLNASINGKITVEKSANEYQEPSVLYTTSTTSGNNGWYKSVSINGSISGTGSNFTGTYCISSSACTPSNSLTLTNNTFTINLSESTENQIVCTTITDEYNKSTTSCTDSYKVDSTAPSVSIASSSSTTDSITINLSGSDTTSGINKYYYSSDNGSTYTSSTSNSYTFSNLSSGTTYTIKVYVEDNAGNISSAVNKSVATESKYAKDVILANKTISKRTDFSTTLTKNTTGTIYSATDDDGTTYYFAGAPTDNYVYFAGFYWRIIRVNGDGSIRMIYDGTSAIANGTSSTDTQISTSKFNSFANNAIYVGFMYKSGSVHGLDYDSTIKGALDKWYTSNLTAYSSYIDTSAGFCNDRYPSTSESTSNGLGGASSNTEPTTYFAAYIRLYTNKSPSFKCQINTDLFTTNSSTKGNKALTYPIGLITADEVAYAGGTVPAIGVMNKSYYLYTGQTYWTMSPKTTCLVFYVTNSGMLGDDSGWDVTTAYGVRPVINLKSTITLSGSGTSSDPYTVS